MLLTPLDGVSERLSIGATATDRWLKLLLDATHTFPWEADLSRHTMSFVGDRSIDVLGYAPEDCTGNGFWVSHIFEQDRKDIVARHLELAATRDEYELEYRMVTAYGRIISVQDMVSVVRVKGQTAWLRGFTMDIGLRKDTEKALRDLGVRLMSQQEEERKRVARELHDDLSQRMAIFCIDIESLRQRDQISPAELKGALDELNQRAKEISGEIHRVAYALHPAKLDDLGLRTALNSLCKEISERHRIDIQFDSEGVDSNISADIKLCLFRIAQEALSNVVRHSGAHTAAVVLRITSDATLLSIADSGKGFDSRGDKTRRGLGLISMTERLRILSGDISIVSNPENGTVVVARIPFPRTKKKDVASIIGAREN